MNPFLPALNELRRLSASGDFQGAQRVREELKWRLELLVRRKCRTPDGRGELANWLGLRRPLDESVEWSPIESLTEQLLEALLRRRAEAAVRGAGSRRGDAWPTVQRPQHAFDTVEV
jgi:hypothetical protein